MNPAGADLVLLAEDEKRAVRLDCLEMQYYRLLATEATLSGHLAEATHFRYGPSCRDVSSAMPQHLVALHAAIGAKAVCCFYQVPHHGSRRNIGPAVLDAIVGPRLPFGSASKATAYVSAAPEAGPKHPSANVTNAFRRRGVQVVATQGNSLCYSRNAPQRYGWGPATALPLSAEETENE
jgi:hypothetical protein